MSEKENNVFDIIESYHLENSRVLGRLIHCINNSLTPIAFGAEDLEGVLEEDELDRDELQEIYQKIIDALKDIKKQNGIFINAYTKHEEEIPWGVDLEELFSDILVNFNRDFQSHGVKAVLEIEGKKEKPFHSAISSIAFPIRELLINAMIAYGDAEEKVMDCKLIVHDDYAEIFISDNAGQTDLTDQVFEQGHSGFENKRLGLGLYHAKKLLELGGGKIEIISPSKPTTFKITTPKAAMENPLLG